MALFWLLPLLLLGMIAVLHWLMIDTALDGNWQIPVLLGVPLLFLDGVFLVQWGRPLWQALRMRPFLRVPDDLQVIEFEESLGLSIHRTSHEANIFLAGSMLIDVPEHWEDEIFRRAGDKPRLSRFALARLTGAQGKVIRLPMNNPHMITVKSDVLLRDIGDIVVGLDDFSIQREMQARLPVLRAHPGMLFIALLLGTAAGILAIAGNQERDSAAQHQRKLQQTLSHLTSRYLEGARVDIPALQARGYEGLAYMPDTQEKIVTGASFHRQLVAQPRQRTSPFLLDRSEWNAIQRASFVFPRQLPGSSSVRPALIDDYRQRLLDRLTGNDAARIRLHALVRDLPGDLIARQLRALTLGNRPDPDFVDALLPTPSVHLEDTGLTPPAGAICREGEALCRVGMRAMMSWKAPAFTASTSGRIHVVHATDVARIFPLRDELAAQHVPPRLSMLTGLALALGVMALLCVLLYWHASRTLKRYWHDTAPV